VRDKNSKVTTGFVAFSVLFLSFLHTWFSLPFPGKKHANVGDGDSHSRGLEFSTPVAWNLAVGNFMVLMCWCGGKPTSSYQQYSCRSIRAGFLALLEVSTNVMQEVVARSASCGANCGSSSTQTCFRYVTQWIRQLSKRLAILVLYHR